MPNNEVKMIKVRLKKVRDTKNAVLYQELEGETDNPIAQDKGMINTQYVRKIAFGSKPIPEFIDITLNF